MLGYVGDFLGRIEFDVHVIIVRTSIGESPIVRAAAMARQQRQQQGAQHIPFVWRVAAAVAQGARSYPTIEKAGGRQKVGEVHELTVRRGRRTFVPAHVHSSAQGVTTEGGTGCEMAASAAAAMAFFDSPIG